MFDRLAQEIEELSIPVDGGALARVLVVLDRLTEKVTAAVGDFDAAGLWADDGCTSMHPWLRSRGVARRDAGRLVATARRLRQLPVTAAAWAAGELSGSQVQVIVGHLNDRRVALFAEHEAALVPSLVALDVDGTERALGEWARKADAVLDDDQPADAQPKREAHLSRTLGDRYLLDASLDAEGGALAEVALRIADPDDRERSWAERRGEALVTVLRFFCDNQQGFTGGRHRPHLNVVVDLESLEQGGHAMVVGGPWLDGPTVERLLCDCSIHRVVFRGVSGILDYGQSTRTATAGQWAALVARDQHCRFPGCDRPVQWCDAHHVRWFRHGGHTALDNLVVLCTRHHHLLHSRAGWDAKLLPDGELHVTKPDGTVMVTRPPARAPAVPLPI
jgi:hypothetical protein